MIYIKTQENELNSVEDIECLDSSYFNLLIKMFVQNNNTYSGYIVVDWKGNVLFATSKCISYKLQVTGVTTHFTYLIINVIKFFQLLLIASSIKVNY